jgi:hypothetical protein
MKVPFHSTRKASKMIPASFLSQVNSSISREEFICTGVHGYITVLICGLQAVEFPMHMGQYTLRRNNE